ADREEGCVRAVAAGRLAVAADPVAREREQQGADAERAEVRGVDQEPAREAGDRPGDRAAEERDAEERDEQQVRRSVQDRHLGEDRGLEDRRQEDRDGHLRRIQAQHSCGLVGTRTSTNSSDEKSAKGWTWMFLYRSVSTCPTLVTTPIGRPFG